MTLRKSHRTLVNSYKIIQIWNFAKGPEFKIQRYCFVDIEKHWHCKVNISLQIPLSIPPKTVQICQATFKNNISTCQKHSKHLPNFWFSLRERSTPEGSVFSAFGEEKRSDADFALQHSLPRIHSVRRLQARVIWNNLRKIWRNSMFKSCKLWRRKRR